MKKPKALKPKPIQSFPARRQKSVSEDDDDYGAKSHKRKVFTETTGGWRRGNKVVTYNETEFNDDFLDSGPEPEEQVQGEFKSNPH